VNGATLLEPVSKRHFPVSGAWKKDGDLIHPSDG
jgi:hypothetical protein